MSTYVLLMNLTEEGIRTIKDAPRRIEEARRALEQAGGRLLAFYTVMGPYDYVAIVEAPDDKVALSQLIALGRGGTVRTLTLKAFTVEEFKEVLEKLP